MLVPGDAIDAHFVENDVGKHNNIHGKTEDRQSYFICAMKEPDYVMRLMATGGRNEKSDETKLTSQTWMEGGVKE